MDIKDALDLSIKKIEIGNENAPCYDGIHLAYMDKKAWATFLDNMKNSNLEAYNSFNEGKGRELCEYTTKGTKCPPKMASYGSSSRMMYNLAKDIKGFSFEKDLPIDKDSTAYPDGYMDLDDKYIFIEAKCHEIYSKKAFKIKTKYAEVYDYITANATTGLNIAYSIIPNDEYMNVNFNLCNGEKVKYYDIKQMICHLCGIANGFLLGTLSPEKAVNFVYLIYKPRIVEVKKIDEKASITIERIFNETVSECEKINHKELFRCIYEFMKTKNTKAKTLTCEQEEKLFKSFKFELRTDTDEILILQK